MGNLAAPEAQPYDPPTQLQAANLFVKQQCHLTAAKRTAGFKSQTLFYQKTYSSHLKQNSKTKQKIFHFIDLFVHIII